MSPEPIPDNARRFRSALGAFATGITIVTTRDPEGRDVGLTANCFHSVSLEPPMVLWSLAKRARSLPAFLAASHFAVHVLAADQEELSRRFAARSSDRFVGLDLERGIAGCRCFADAQRDSSAAPPSGTTAATTRSSWAQ